MPYGHGPIEAKEARRRSLWAGAPSMPYGHGPIEAEIPEEETVSDPAALHALRAWPH